MQARQYRNLVLAFLRARALAPSAGGVCMHAPTRTRAVHHPKDLWALCRCGGVNGRAAVGHMPGSCSYARVHGFFVCTAYALKEAHAARRRHARSRGLRLQGFPSGRFGKWYRLLLVLEKQFRAEEAPSKTYIMRILALKLTF